MLSRSSESASHGVRRCDGRCHNATHEVCVCWCGGLFHGKQGAENRGRMREIIDEKFPGAELDEEGFYYIREEKDQLSFKQLLLGKT